MLCTVDHNGMDGWEPAAETRRVGYGPKIFDNWSCAGASVLLSTWSRNSHQVRRGPGSSCAPSAPPPRRLGGVVWGPYVTEHNKGLRRGGREWGSGHKVLSQIFVYTNKNYINKNSVEAYFLNSYVEIHLSLCTFESIVQEDKTQI